MFHTNIKGRETSAVAGLSLGVLLIVLLLIAVEVLMLSPQASTVRLASDSPAATALLTGFHAVEQDSRGDFRWTGADNQLMFSPFGQGTALLLRLQLGAPPSGHAPPALALQYEGLHPVRFATGDRPRHYYLLVPRQALHFGRLTIALQSPTVTLPPDTRALGVRFEEARLTALSTGILWPTLAQIITQLLLFVFCALLLYRLGVPPLALNATLLLIAAAVLLLYHEQLLLATLYIDRVITALEVLLVLTFGLLPLAERHLSRFGSPQLIRVLWGITVLACAIRLIGALYPLFTAYDLPLNQERLLNAATGALVMTNRSFEFRGGIAIYPAGPYIVLLPGLLLGIAPKLLIQAGIALLDGVGALTTALLARAIGASARVAILSALIYATVPIGLASLWWGHSAQVFGQGLMAPLALALLLGLRYRCARYWLVAGVLLCMALLTHIGVTILAFAWLGLVWLALSLRRKVTLAAWWRLSWMLAISALLGLLLVYSTVIALQLQETEKVSRLVFSGDNMLDGSRLRLIAKAFWISFSPLGLLLLPSGLLLLLNRRWDAWPHTPELIGAWLITVALFWVVEMLSALQVRYLVFWIPTACILIGMVLDRLAIHGRAAHWVGWTVAGLLVVQGAAAWFAGTFMDIQMSMIPLLR